MLDTDKRDFFISFNSADLAHAEAINAALRDAGYRTHFHPTDIGLGESVLGWMRRTLPDSVQVLGLASPDYFKAAAEYSELERIATQWGDPLGLQRRLVFVDLKPCDYNPFDAHLKRITETSGMLPDAAAAKLVEVLARAAEVRERAAERAAAALPAIHNFRRPRVAHFTGRDEALAGLHRTLAEGKNAAVTQTIAGLGGVGKTTLASEYVHRFGTAGRYGGVWWVPAETESGLVASLGDLAKALGQPESNDLPAMARFAVDRLAAMPQPWLVVFDNAPDPDALRWRLPTGETGTWVPGGQTRVLITSRFADFAGIAETTRLDQWDEATTADYLLRATGRDDREGALVLAKVLDGLPLAADQAAGYLRGRAKTFAAYAGEIGTLLQRERDRGNQGDYPETVYATLVKSLAELPEATVDLLCLLAWLSPDGTEIMFVTHVAQHWPEFLPDRLVAAFADEDARDDTIRAAWQVSLLSRAEDKDWGEMLVLHRMTQTVLRAWQRNEGRDGWDVRAARVVASLFVPGTNTAVTPQVWPLCARLLPHALALAGHGPRAGEGAEALGRLLNQAGGYLAFARGDTEGAIAILAANVDLTADAYGEDHPNYTAALSNLAGRYSDAGRLDEAEAAFLRVIEIGERLLDPDDPVLAIHKNNLGRVYSTRQDFARAEPLLQRALEIGKMPANDGTYNVAGGANALGALYDDWAELPGEAHRRAEARRLQEEAIRIARAVRGERHPEVSAYLHNLAVLLERQEDYAGAAEHELRAVAIMLSLGLLEHPHTQQRIDHLFAFWERSGQGASAEALGQRVVPEIAEVERLMHAWVAEDPENRHFGPPGFEEHGGRT